jgi:exportin-2 (importin alpha re-exporter)
MIGITIRKESPYGVSEVNHNVNLMEFFSTHIIPELHDTNSSNRPMVKATSLNFVCIFRNQFNQEQLISLLPLLMNHLASDVVVIHTLAAYTIERILWMREMDASGALRDKLSSTDIQPFLQTLFSNLFNIVDNIILNENEYVMKCIMRLLDKAGADVIPVTGIIFEKLASALDRVMKNPRNPGFNHSLFESIALLVKNCCSADPTKTVELEALLFPPFQHILQMEVAEFSPYVFQILAQLLEYRPEGSGLGDAYGALFPVLLTPQLWVATGNVPALVRFLQAYLKRAAAELLGHLVPMLGIFQKLLASKATEQGSMDLLSSLTIYIPQTNLLQYCKQFFNMILIRLNGMKSKRFPLLVAQYFGLFAGIYGGQAFIATLDSIQPGIGKDVTVNIWLRHLLNAANSKLAAKTQVIGLARVLCEGPLLGDDNGKLGWAQILHGVVTLLASPSFSKEEKDLSEEVSVEYDATFSQLKFARKVPDDPFVTVADPLEFFVNSLKGVSSMHPGILLPVIQQGLSGDPKLAATFSNMCESKGIILS